MAMFSVNQVRQFYVVNSLASGNAPTKAGEIVIKNTADEEEAFIVHQGKMGTTRTDLIPIKNVMWAHLTPATKLRRELNSTIITMAQSITLDSFRGRDFIVKLLFDSYTFPSENSIFVKYGCVHVVSGMNESDFYTKLGMSLAGNIARDEVKPVNIFAVTDSGFIKLSGASSDLKLLAGKVLTGVAVVENPQPWYLGTMEQITVRWNVEGIPVLNNDDNEEVNWITPESLTKVAPEKFSTLEGYKASYITNGKKVADMEYFYHGERGDMYRDINWPKSFRTTYEVNTSTGDVETEYDLIDIHYAFTDSHEGVQKSERTLTLAIEAGLTAGDIKTRLEEVLKCKVKEVK